jgi:hypothetical protein
MELALAIASLITSALTIGGALVAIGTLVQRLRDLERRHGENTAEHRTGHADHEGRIRGLEVGHARSSTQLETARGRGP